MAITTRQTSLLVQQDWTKIYQTFREADFQSFDYETLRKSMIEYLRTYYPEDFNDYTESSEYIALIDLIAFLGQSLAFRADLNARENFIDTAERRDSILKLARLVSYNPKRSTPAAGYMKFDSVSTTETIFDSTGVNLSNTVINWNDTSNENWLEQFTSILNAALVASQAIGKPGATKNLSGVRTDEYTVDIIAGVTPTYPYSSSIAGVTYPFEIVSATSANQEYIYESTPSPGGAFNFLYRNDNQGNSSNNTGYFFYFKQGTLNSLDFTITESLPNRIVNINFDNINNTDVWLYSLTTGNNLSTLWTQVPAVNGVNVIYNNLDQRNLYSVASRANDQIDLVFGDGSFTNIPVGNFRIYYRVSNNLTYKITPDEMAGITINIPYRGRTGRAETLTVRASLQYTVTNAISRESLESIRTNAPQQYYTQNRMVTGEDYNVLPFTTFNNILKLKATNRTSSGISRYLDVIDATGKYSSTNIFAQDGIIYKEDYTETETFQFTSTVEVNSIVRNTIKPLISNITTRHLYYDTATRNQPLGPAIVASSMVAGKVYKIISVGTSNFVNFGASENTVGTIFTATDAGAGTGTVSLVATWTQSLNSGGRSFGTFNSPNYSFLVQGSLVKFIAPAGKYFDAQNQIQTGTPTTEYQKTTLWASIIDYDSPGLTSVATLSTVIPTNAIVSEIIPVFANDWSENLINNIILQILSYKTFGIRYDIPTMTWNIIESQNLGDGNFSLVNAGSTAGTGLDDSWFLSLSFSNGEYTVISRGINYFFESERETRFYFDPDIRVYDSRTATTLVDSIKVLRTNTQPDSSQPLFYSQIYRIWEKAIGADGIDDNRKIRITFPDDNLDEVPDNPDLFLELVAPTINSQNKNVFFVQSVNQYNFLQFDPIDQDSVVSAYSTKSSIIENITLYASGTIFYASEGNPIVAGENVPTFYQSVGSDVITVTNYIARTGRQQLQFQYKHNSPNNRRIDPSPNNLIDFYILTKTYANDYIAYITDTSGKVAEPESPTISDLRTEFGSIETFKTISDSIIYNPAVFKPLFGNKANPALRSTFKVIKNPNVTISDNEIKSQVIAAINTYFDVNNWDFGETFYFSELSAYLHSVLAPNISSIVIVPSNTGSQFGTLYQINAEPDEILISAATVDNVQIISAITAAQLNTVS
jgi:hypothetical protein